ncbi:MAG: DUF3617 domain-containing protein [Caulobacterales bacterium]
MTLFHHASLATVALVSLGACSRTGSETNNAAATADATSTGTTHTTVSPTDLPSQKAGYWAYSLHSSDGLAQEDRACENERTIAPSEYSQYCSGYKAVWTPSGDIIIDESCVQAGSELKTHVTLSGDFSSNYTSDGETTVTTGDQPPRTVTFHFAARYLGPCDEGKEHVE